MVIPRVLSRGTSVAAQRAHFAGILDAASELPAVIYNSPYYGFETKADLFFDLREDHPNLVGFKEFGEQKHWIKDEDGYVGRIFMEREL